MEFSTGRSKTKHSFIHFDTAAMCDMYLKNNMHLEYAHKCCSGKGVAIIKIFTDEIKNKDILNDVTIPSTVGTCDICFNEEITLYKTCNRCSHPFCMCCLKKIVSEECPYCRGKLTKLE